MAFSKWFWDEFPKHCTTAWWVFMIALLVITAFWRDPVYNWFAGNPLILLSGFFALSVLLFIGNYIPGVPNMPLPLLLGWAIASGAPIWPSITLSIAGWFVAWAGSLAIFYEVLGWTPEKKDIHRGTQFIRRWHLDESTNFHKAYTAVQTQSNVVVRSRIGKFAALCGHVNIAAALCGYLPSRFGRQALLGHLLWTYYYVLIGFLIGWLMPYVGMWFR